jgi:hypothetical protein
LRQLAEPFTLPPAFTVQIVFKVDSEEGEGGIQYIIGLDESTNWEGEKDVCGPFEGSFGNTRLFKITILFTFVSISHLLDD